MTTSSVKLRRRRTPVAAFTLVEVMISASLAAFILTGIMTTFLFIGRSEATMANYIRLEQQARRGLERFAEDTRMASGVDSTQTSPTSWPNQVILTVPHASDSNSNTVTWWWSQTSGSTYHCLMRKEVDNSGVTVSTETIMSNIAAFQFDRWTAGSTTGTQATNDLGTDQLQIHLTLQLQTNEYGTTSSAVAAASNLVVSARYILRNKL